MIAGLRPSRARPIFLSMPPSRRTYTVVSEQTWTLIRAAYLSGLSGAVTARRFGVSLPALRKRAQREGWTKQAYAAASGAADASPRPDAPPPSLNPDVLVKTALGEAARALADGRPYAARACASAGEAMARLAARRPDYIEADELSEIEARHRYWMSAVEEIALGLAAKLARGEPMPPEYAALEARWREQGLGPA